MGQNGSKMHTVAPPRQTVQPTCPINQSCHICGRGIKEFGSKFKQRGVRNLSSSSVLFFLVNDVEVVNKDEKKTFPKGSNMGSGTLIQADVVLSASHVFELFEQLAPNFSWTDIGIRLFAECDCGTAAPGFRGQNSTGWTSCNMVSGAAATGRVVKDLESGFGNDLDYILVAITWDTFPDSTSGVKTVMVPRNPVAGKPSAAVSKGQEVLLIGHPLGEPTQASAGVVTQVNGPHPTKSSGGEYTYATFIGLQGYSGGGVFNESGELIGVNHGASAKLGNCCLNLASAAAAATGTRLQQWFKGGAPRKSGDPQEAVVFQPLFGPPFFP